MLFWQKDSFRSFLSWKKVCAYLHYEMSLHSRREFNILPRFSIKSQLLQMIQPCKYHVRAVVGESSGIFAVVVSSQYKYFFLLQNLQIRLVLNQSIGIVWIGKIEFQLDFVISESYKLFNLVIVKLDAGMGVSRSEWRFSWMMRHKRPIKVHFHI